VSCLALTAADKLDKNEAAQQWLLRHPRVHFYYTATHASWMNMIECFFSHSHPAGADAEHPAFEEGSQGVSAFAT
jgi:hypothetical protein